MSVSGGAFHAEPFSAAAGHNARIFDVGFSPAEPDLLASASDDECVKVWRRTAAGEQGPAYSLVATCHDHTDSVMRVNWSPDGSLIASGAQVRQPREGLVETRDLGYRADPHFYRLEYGVWNPGFRANLI